MKRLILISITLLHLHILSYSQVDEKLSKILSDVYEEDQKYRQQIEGIQKKFGWNSDEIHAHWKIINKMDSINLIQIEKILNERGWLSEDIIGTDGNSALFLVIQHSDIKTQEKYLPMMREAVTKGNARASSLALLEDRVALRRGKRQIYGSQIGKDPETGEAYVLPLEDPENVDKRRADVGLGSIQEYVSMWGLKWNWKEYLKQLPDIENKQKK